MVVGHFLKWAETAPASARAAAAAALARAYCGAALSFEDRCATEAALTLLLDDPSAKVRAAMADALSMSRHAPPQVIAALAADQPDVAAAVIARSPLLSDGDLVDRVAIGGVAIQLLVARRPSVSMSVSAALAEIGEAEACRALLGNDGAAVAGVSLRRITERFAHLPAIREALVADPRLPPECRHMLVLALGQAFRQSPLVTALIGAGRTERVLRDACVKSSLTLIEATDPAEHPALVEHLRLQGELTSAFVLRTVALGRIDFFGAALAALSGQALPRVRSLLAGGQDGALFALFGRAGLAASTHPVIGRALKIWREVALGRRVAGVQEVSFAMLEALGGLHAESQLATLLKSIHFEALRENARAHARAVAEAA